MSLNVIITGTTGMVGEGVLIECLMNPQVKQILSVVRRPTKMKDAKLKELVVPDFMHLDGAISELKGYDACFFCAGVSSVGIKEPEYTRITYDTTIHFAATAASLNPQMVFCYVSGQGTSSSPKSKIMWARVKGKTENDLMQLPLKSAYNFRPGVIAPTKGQQHLKPFYRVALKLIPVFRLLFPGSILTMKELGQAMINSVLHGYNKNILEVKDIKALAAVH
jgi:hypothetical protein